MAATDRGSEQASRANRLATRGVDAVASIDSMAATGNADPAGSQEYDIAVTVRPAGEPPYEAQTRQYIHPAATFAEGMDVTVKVDPDDSGELILWDRSSGGEL
jgi:hypothetical protein